MGMSLGPSYLIRPSFSRPGGTEANARVQETLAPGIQRGRRPAMLAVNGYSCKG
jgi:hypothetical protein